MSDLHLGALNSVLTSVDEKGEVDRQSIAATTSALAECMYALHQGDDDPPALVVLGDLFELALVSTDLAAASFGQFVSALRIGRPDAVVAPRIHFIPGNHDHRLWTQARDANYLEHLRDIAGNDTDLPDARHSTPLLSEQDNHPVRDRFVEALASRADGGDAVQVHQSYPNLGMVAADGSKAVVVSHGHFVEPLYRLMSNLDIAFGLQARGYLPEAAQLEADNASWIDFFWSSMGDSGDVSGVVSHLYESLQSPEAMELEIKLIKQFVSNSRYGVRGRVEASLLATVLRREVVARLQRERHRPDPTLSPAAQVGLDDYLRGPVRYQLGQVGVEPADTTFVFGHTHKPFVDRRSIPGYPNAVTILNTGGWVVDSLEPDENKGAAVVVIDDDANVAVVRFYIQGADPSSYRVSVSSGDANLENPLVAQLAGRVDPSRDPWQSMGDALAAAVEVRSRQLGDRLEAQMSVLRQVEMNGRRRD